MSSIRKMYAFATSPKGRLAARAIAVGVGVGLHSGKPGVGAVTAGALAAAEAFTPLNGIVGLFKQPDRK